MLKNHYKKAAASEIVSDAAAFQELSDRFY
jgi:hypothetical protein